jgi:HAD superfamily hydrolase (TIGR01509 family)
MIRCILFDMDDTLLKLDVDWVAMTKDIDWEFFGGKYSYMTPHKFFVAYFSRLMGKLTKKQQALVRKRRLETELQGIPSGQCFAYDYVLADLKKKYKLGVVSGNYRPTVKKALSVCGLNRYIKVAISIDDIPYSKPSPQPLLFAAWKLKAKPSETVYVGDHPDDMRAGQAAGMGTIGVAANAFALKRLKAVKPNAIVRHIGELPRLMEKMNRFK